MMVLSGKPIKEATIEDLQMVEAHIKECYVKMSNSEDATEKEYLQMDIDISKKARELIMKELNL
jgi:hypothetical protein